MGKLFIYFFLHLLLLDLQGNVAIIKSLLIHLLNDAELRNLTNIKTCKHNSFWIFIPRLRIVAGYDGFTLILRESVHPSGFRFRMIPSVNINGFLPNLVYALILWRSGFGLLMGKFRQILTELSARDKPIFSFPDDNLNKRQWIFTKLGMCIHIVEIWFWIANGQILSIFDGVICPRHAHIFITIT